jgi:TorA maturation chaperone TorD
MGGGKETPRQKMISMMYIVLTALLALNVSKQILEAYIAIEENIQLANISESDRGNDKFDAIKEKATDKVEKSQKAIEIYKIAQELDKLTTEQIRLLDEAKIMTLIALEEP